MPTETVTFDGWEGGEIGDLGSREAAKKAVGQERRVRVSPGFWLPTQFSGKNMMRYRDGLLGPRAGVKNLGVTGLGNGKVRAMGSGSTGTWVVIGQTVYAFLTGTYGGAATAYTMTDLVADTFTKPGETPTKPGESDDIFGVSYLLVYGLNSYKINHATTTVTKLAGATKIPNGRSCVYYQNRLIVGGTDVYPSRLFYSDPGSAGYETFQATSYYDLPGYAITSLFPFRSGLLVGTFGGSFIYITGTLGSSAVIRTLSRNGAPADPPKGKVLATDEVVLLASERTFIQRYNGAVYTDETTLRWAGDNYFIDIDPTPQYRVERLRGPGDYLFLSGNTSALNKALMRYEGVHSYHTWEKNIGAWAQGGQAKGNVLLCKDGTDGATAPVFYIFTTELNRPAFASDTDAQPGDDSTTPLDAYAHLNQFFDPQGRELHVTGVIVDFKKWNTGAAATNHFDISVRALGRYSAGPIASSTLSWDEAVASSSTSGDDFRVQFGFGDQGHSSGFEIWLDNIRGVAIRSVTVMFDRGESYTT